MSCPSCNTVVGLKESLQSTDKSSGITKCKNCGAFYKNNPKKNIVLYSAGALAFFGGPVNDWLFGANDVLFGASYAVAVGLFIWYYAMSKSILVNEE